MKSIYKAYTALNYAKRMAKGNSIKTKYYQYIKSLQHLPYEQLIDLQKTELSHLLQYSFKNIDAYKKYDGEINTEEKSILQEIKHVTPLTKNDIINCSDSHINHSMKNVIKYETGGTSANSAIIYKGISEELMNADEYQNQTVGIYSGKSRIMLKRAQHTYYNDNKEYPPFEFEPLKRTYTFDVNAISEKNFEKIYQIHKRVKPKILWGITRPVYDYARFLIATNKDFTPFEVIVVGGQTLLPSYENLIEDTFKGPVINKYGSTEGGSIAMQCLSQEGLHYVPIIYYIEILDKNMNQVKEDEYGDLYISVLNSRYFPLIRYKTNDVAQFSSKACSCGVTFPSLKSVSGRDIESILAPNHSIATPGAIDKIVHKLDNIYDFQAIQNHIDGFDLRLVLEKGSISDIDKRKITKELCELFEYDMKIKIHVVDEIKKQANGKVLNVISSI